MLDLKFVLDNLELVKERTGNRSSDFDFEALTSLADKRKKAIYDFESLRAEQKRASGGMRSLKPGSDEFNALRASLKEMSDTAKSLEDVRKGVDEELATLLLQLPNLHSDETPVGSDEEQNIEVRTWGEIPSFDFEVKDHVDLGMALDILDQESAAKVSGARFTFLKGMGARLERALQTFMLDIHTREHGYTELAAPALVHAHALQGTGQLPKFEEDLFHADDGLYLIPTAEVPVTNYYRETILESLDETIAFVAATPCFRREAGSHGRDTRGLIRQHQFNKVELVKICRPEDSHEEHMKLLGHAEKILQLLELPYRVVELCSGDIGFSAKRCFDIEVWVPSQEKFREISSCSNFGDFQARRAQIRFRNEDRKATFAHTLNGSGLAVGRTLVAVLENYQNADGSIRVPRVLQPYMGCTEIELS